MGLQLPCELTWLAPALAGWPWGGPRWHCRQLALTRPHAPSIVPSHALTPPQYAGTLFNSAKVYQQLGWEEQEGATLAKVRSAGAQLVAHSTHSIRPELAPRVLTLASVCSATVLYTAAAHTCKLAPLQSLASHASSCAPRRRRRCCWCCCFFAVAQLVVAAKGVSGSSYLKGWAAMRSHTPEQVGGFVCMQW